MSQAIIESRKIADQIESGKIPPPSRAQAVTLIRQMVQLAERLEAAESERDATLARIAELERENAELRKDAERYRWLREHNGFHGYGVQVAISRPIDKDTFWVHCDEGLDAAIDAALASEKENERG